MHELEILHRFDQPSVLTSDALTQIEYVRDTMKIAVDQLLSVTPESRERSIAVTKLEEAMFWSNAAIAREDVRLQEHEQQGQAHG